MPRFDHGTSRIHFDDTGTGETVLLLPGFSDSIDNHAPLRTALTQRYRVIAADLPGSGRSDPQPRPYHPHYYEEDATSFLVLLQERDAPPAHVLGYSDGGEVALLMAILAPKSVRSVLTWGASGHIEDPGGHICAAFRNIVDHPIPEMQTYRDDLVAAYGAGIARATTQSFADNLADMVAAGGDICRNRADQIRCPVLLMVGQHDPFVTKPLVDALSRRILSSEVMEVAGAGHGVHEHQPERFSRAVLDWLSKH